MKRVVGVQCTMCGVRGVLEGQEAWEFTRSYPDGAFVWCGRHDCPGILVPWPSELPGRVAWEPSRDQPGGGPEVRAGAGPEPGGPTRRRPP